MSKKTRKRSIWKKMTPIIALIGPMLGAFLLSTVIVTIFVVNPINARIDRVEGHIDKVEASTNARFDKMEVSTNARFDKVETRIDKVEASTNARMDAGFAEVNRRIDALIDAVLNGKSHAVPASH